VKGFGNSLALLFLLAIATSAQGGESAKMRVAITGDPQNYFTTSDPNVDAATFKALVSAQIADIVAYHPDFVIVAGDITDSTGGPDTNCSAGVFRIGDDSNHQAVVADSEWTNFRRYEYDVLRAAGIPVFLVVGNHDSAVDFERHFPASEWMTYTSISPEVDSRPLRAGGQTFASGPNCAKPTWTGAYTSTDTTHRKALIPTAIGSVCVLGMPDATFDTDSAWVNARIGCGADRPTILVSHAGDALNNNLSGMTARQKQDIVANVYGHYVCTGCDLMFQHPTSANGLSYLDIFVNTQEQLSGIAGGGLCSADLTRRCATSRDCARLSPATCLGMNHSGMSWWMSWEIDPSANTSTTRAHNPFLGGLAHPPPGSDFTLATGVVTLPFDYCGRFGCGGH